jgi:hypothetical protein
MVKVDAPHLGRGITFPHLGQTVSSEASTFLRLTFFAGAWAVILAQDGVVEIVGKGDDPLSKWLR